MRPRRRAPGVAVLALGLVAGTTAVPAANASPVPDHSPPGHSSPGHSSSDSPAPAGEARSVTLVTGDRVVLAGDRLVSLDAGPGREHIAFHRFQRDGRLHVVPRDAAEPLAAGELDPRLFDVTGLVEAGYDDASRDTVPLIVTGAGQVAAAGVQVTRALPAVNAVAAQAPKADAGSAWRTLLADPGVTGVWLDGVRRPTLDRSTAQIGAPAAWRAGYTGKGVQVAVLDTGVDGDHPDLADKETAERNFTDDPDATDRHGHGTHVASTVASAGPKYRGVAPDAEVLDGKVCAGNGSCRESWIIAGMQWAVDQGAEVVNLSLGGTDTAEVDPLEQALTTLSEQSGTLFVVAAGNAGGTGTVSSPASADAALAVGAVERDDGIAPFSSRGPRVGDGAPKPDVTAPGVDIVAARAAEGVAGTPVGDGHVAMSGTSMASPHVAGAAALLAQQHPDWDGDRIKAALMASAAHNPALTAFDQGAGRVDLARALTTAVTADPPSLALGLQQWPHDDDVPVTGSFAIRNPGDQPLTLDLTVEAKGPDGAPAPAGLFTVSPARVTVPAGGQAEVAVTADTRAGTVDGGYSGTVLASGGDTRLRVPVGANREVESYDVAFEFTDAAGRPTDDHFSLLFGLDNIRSGLLRSTGGRATTRLPVGEYFLMSEVTTGEHNALLVQPSLRITGPDPVAVDARVARPLRFTYPDPAARPLVGDVLLARGDGTQLQLLIGSVYRDGFGDMAIGHLGPELPADRFEVLIGEQAAGTPVGTTSIGYRFASYERGRAPTGLTVAPARRDLAEVRSEFGAGPAGRTHGYVGYPLLPLGFGGLGWDIPVTAPGRAVDYTTTHPDLRWGWDLWQHGDDGTEALLSTPLRTLHKGRTYRERLNDPVFGPALPASAFPYLSRDGDRVEFRLPLFGDRHGNGGQSLVSSARTRLLRDGVEVGRTPDPGSGRFTVPPGEAEYRVETEAKRREGVSEFSAEVRGAWTFRSDTAPGGRVVPLPLTVVRFTPALDAAGAAPAGRVLPVPLVVEQQEGAANGRVGRLRVEVSFDDGKTWSRAPVVGRAALVRNPAGAGYASLRVAGSDSAGNTFEHTAIRAYKIAG